MKTLFESELLSYTGENLSLSINIPLDNSKLNLVLANQYSSTGELLGEVVIPKASFSISELNVELGSAVAVGNKVKVQLIEV